MRVNKHRVARYVFLAAVLLVATTGRAWADATVFVGANTTPANRLTRGAAVGIGLLVVGFEFEYSATDEDLASGAPSLKVGSGNALLQTPIPIFGFQPYVTAGVGFYSEQLSAHDDTGFGQNVGGGVKIALAGPLRLRVDYRVFHLGSDALYSPSHRFYAGVNLKF
jgi:opacity protein-like surface antigen